MAAPDPPGYRLALLEDEMRAGYRGAEERWLAELRALCDQGHEIDATSTLLWMLATGRLLVRTKGRRLDPELDRVIEALHAFGATDPQIADYLETIGGDVDEDTIKVRRHRRR